jgi:hypothetical protein
MNSTPDIAGYVFPYGVKLMVFQPRARNDIIANRVAKICRKRNEG